MKPNGPGAGTLCVLMLLTAVASAAAEAPATKPATNPTATPASKPDEPKTGDDKLSVTEHQIALADGTALRYEATAGRMTLKDDSEKPKGEFFFVAYRKLPAASDPSKRPITFLFNGGPGAASVWLHIGAVGPQRLALDERGDPPSPPYRLEANPDTWLSASDLVFIDPIGTGYSRPAAGEKGEQFFGVQEDIRWVAEFIRLYTTRNQRWLSPKFLAGESYGTTRAAGLSSYLLDNDGISINGIVLISSVLNFQTLQAQSGNDLPFELYVPSFAAAAWYHKKLAPDLQADLQKTLNAAEDFALGPYANALSLGSALPPERKNQVAGELARFTGLSQEYVESSDLRIRPDRFEAMLLHNKREVIGRFDARITGFNPDAAASTAEYDPSLSPFLAAYAGTFNDYVRRTLNFESDLPYEVLTGKVQPWNFGEGGSGYLDVSPSLQGALLGNPTMKVMFASGYFDLATPFATATYTINHLKLSDELRGQIVHKCYDGGHMLYHNRESLKKLNADVRDFITQASATLPPASQPKVK